MSEHITTLNLVLNVVQPKFSSLLRRVSKILKFTKSFIEFVNFFLFKGETRGLELRPACSCEPVKQSRPLIPIFKSLVCLQLRDEVEVKTPRTLKGHAIVLKHCMRFVLKNL